MVGEQTAPPLKNSAESKKSYPPPMRFFFFHWLFGFEEKFYTWVILVGTENSQGFSKSQVSDKNFCGRKGTNVWFKKVSKQNEKLGGEMRGRTGVCPSNAPCTKLLTSICKNDYGIVVVNLPPYLICLHFDPIKRLHARLLLDSSTHTYTEPISGLQGH